MSLWNYERASNGTDASGVETAFARRLRSQPIIQHRQTQTLAVCSAVSSEKMNTTKRNPQAQKARPIARASFSLAGLVAVLLVLRPSFTAVVNCYRKV
jgi:hypothetical protein